MDDDLAREWAAWCRTHRLLQARMSCRYWLGHGFAFVLRAMACASTYDPQAAAASLDLERTA